MDLLVFLAVSFAVLMTAYHFVGRALARVFKVASRADTPAHTMRDGLDYEPARASYLLPQHFSAIAAAGPIVGPILAGQYFGWGPTWLWIILGSILVGGIHDFTALLASVRHKARSIAEIVRVYMNPRAYLLFLIFIWLALVYVIIAFADVTAGTFVAAASNADAQAPGPAVATSSFLYLGLAVLMGLTLRFTKLGPVKAKIIFLPLVFGAIILGPYLPIDLTHFFLHGDGLTAQQIADGRFQAQRLWGYILLVYCFVAALAPVWALLQPRGELGGYFLYIVMIAAVGGVLVGAFHHTAWIEQPAFKGWTSVEATKSLGFSAGVFPILFITVACGACSGFHSIVASGTTSKQLYTEADARPVAYGGMLLEGFFACISLATVMILKQSAGKPDSIYAQGIRDFASEAGGLIFHGAQAETMRNVLFQFALLCFATFVFDTLDACTRLARYVMMEMFGWKTRNQALLATALSLALPAITLALPPVKLDGVPLPLWKVFWNIFGSSNQLLAALTLLGITVWLAKKKMPYWITLGPTILMMTMTLWSLVLFIPPYVTMWNSGKPIEIFRHLQFGITVSLIILSVWLIIEALITWMEMRTGSGGVADAGDEVAASAG